MQLQYFGLTARVVNSCRQAIKAVSKHHYPLILIGWGRPECTGWIFIEFVRQQEQKRHLSTKIVAVLSHRTPGAQSSVLSAGMDDYICKPITMSDMHGMLAKHLNQAA